MGASPCRAGLAAAAAPERPRRRCGALGQEPRPAVAGGAAVAVGLSPEPQSAAAAGPDGRGELSDVALRFVLSCLAEGGSLGAAAAVSAAWAEASCHPQLWRSACARGASPVAGRRGPGVWGELAAAARGSLVAGWPVEVAPEQTTRLLAALARGIGGRGPDWTALAALQPPLHQRSAALTGLGLVAATSPPLLPARSLRGALAAAASVWQFGSARCCGEGGAKKRTTRRLVTPFLRCPRLFPSAGGFSLWLEEQELADGEVHLSLRLSSPPRRPLGLRVLLVLECGVLDAQLELRANGASRVRLLAAESGAPPASSAKAAALGSPAAAAEPPSPLECLGAALGRVCDAGKALRAEARSAKAEASRSTIGAVVALSRPSGDLEGRPGGSGWIPWSPARPTLVFMTG
ncbi:unnamed protein product [Prorocentrum cordatum]|uniref:Anaphase-promoting complex subunit 1 n=1 Tax=Prorocentrum cordatum TaxID=2364126 RepID=A0ABN9SX12_9DINO|nr:unnamed protein product [Polarella glacialis]